MASRKITENNRGSKLLEDHENNDVFASIGRRCVVSSQLYFYKITNECGNRRFVMKQLKNFLQYQHYNNPEPIANLKPVSIQP